MTKCKQEPVHPLELSNRKVLRLHSNDPSMLIFINQYISFLVEDNI